MAARTESPDLQNGYHASNGYGTRTVEIIDEVRSRDDARHNTENAISSMLREKMNIYTLGHSQTKVR